MSTADRLRALADRGWITATADEVAGLLREAASELDRANLGQSLRPLLSDDEERIVAVLGQVFTMFSENVIGQGRSGQQDRAEFAAYIHALQNIILAQAAARAYPGRYRLAGETLATDTTDG